MNHILRIGSRKSVLALRQAEMIAEQLKNKFPGLQTEILTRDTLGDQLLRSPLQAFGGKGAFVSEFEQAPLTLQSIVPRICRFLFQRGW